MRRPETQIVAISNVYSRLMHFVHKGDMEIGHTHTYDHATLVSTGSVRYEVLDSTYGRTIASKEFKAPGYIFVEKNKHHKIVALEDNTVCVCIHALRTIDEDIIPPDALIDPLYSNEKGEIKKFVEEHTGKEMARFTA